MLKGKVISILATLPDVINQCWRWFSNIGQETQDGLSRGAKCNLNLIFATLPGLRRPPGSVFVIAKRVSHRIDYAANNAETMGLFIGNERN